jgi:uncharacterized protein (DUF736 family)
MAETVRVAFHGNYIDPARFPLPGISHDPARSGKLAPERAQSFFGGKQVGKSIRIGTYEKIGDNEHKLRIYLPFLPPGRFVCKAADIPPEKRTDKTPVQRIFMGPVSVGAIWLKKTTDGKLYKSGNLLAPWYDSRGLWFAIFKGEDENSLVHNVVASFDEQQSAPDVAPGEDF